MKVLVTSYDHQYREAHVQKMKVVKDENGNYSEYVGDEYLDPGDEVVEMDVVE